MIQTYWLERLSETKSILGCEIDISFGTIYLGIIPTDLNAQDKYLIKILLVVSKKAINKKCLDRDPPTKREWIAIVQGMYDMEKLTFSLRLSKDKFHRYWSKWLLHVSEYCLSSPHLVFTYVAYLCNHI